MAKKINRPHSKHKPFPTTQFRLIGNDWMICVHNCNNQQAHYFLAEPVEEGSGFTVYALNRAGNSTSSFPGLPRKFKTTDLAAEWLEDQADDYDGDTFVEKTKAPRPTAPKNKKANVPNAPLNDAEEDKYDALSGYAVNLDNLPD